MKRTQNDPAVRSRMLALTFILTVIAAAVMHPGVASAAVVLHSDDFSTNTLAADYNTLGVTYNTTPETVTIARGSGSNYLEIKETFDLDFGQSTELTVSFNWAFGASMFGSGFLVQYNDNAGTGWQTILSQGYNGDFANDVGTAGDFSTVTISEGGTYAFTDGAAVRIIGTTNSGSKGYNFDNLVVQVDNFIPAPAALPAGLMMIGFVAARRRRRHG